MIYLLNYMTICLLGIVAAMLTTYASDSKYSVVKAFARLLFCFDTWYIKWFFRDIQNMLYFFSSTCVLFLIVQDIVLLTLFSQSNIFQKPIFVFIVSPLLWLNLGIVLFLSLFNFESIRKKYF